MMRLKFQYRGSPLISQSQYKKKRKLLKVIFTSLALQLFRTAHGGVLSKNGHGPRFGEKSTKINNLKKNKQQNNKKKKKNKLFNLFHQMLIGM